MKVEEIREILRKVAPEEYALDWDNSGLILGRREKEIQTILVTVDVDDAAVNTALEQKADLIVSHHPLLFQPVKRITDEEFIGKRLVKLIQADVAYYAMHTNYDICRMGMLAAEKIGLEEISPLEETGEWNGAPCGIGVCGVLKQEESLSGFARRIRERFGLEELRCFGEDRLIRRVAVCPGSGGSVVRQALSKKADVFLSGDIGHHTGIDADAQGMAVLDAGHYGLEYLFMKDMQQYLEEHIDGSIQVLTMPKHLPYSVII
nr:Nif3-like dinuclear metal center hexameric protein [uncultured Sellimonas sp.]